MVNCFFFFQAEEGIGDLVRSRGLGDVYKRQEWQRPGWLLAEAMAGLIRGVPAGALVYPVYRLIGYRQQL